MRELLVAFAKDEEGATVIEYALLAFLLSVFIIGALTSIGSTIGTTFDTTANSLKTANR